jgi:putative FmdB family regulatory protein
MPTYSWKCEDCGTKEITIVPMVERDRPPTSSKVCQEDRPHKWVRILETGGFKLEGPGWYRDGYR